MLSPNQSERTQEPVVESASATTSPDNANSGSSAYVITAVGLGLVLLLCMGVANCTSNLVTNTIGALERLEYYEGDDIDPDMLLDEEDFDLYSSPDTKDELEELLERMRERGEEGTGLSAAASRKDLT